jgi:Na+-driven multidrug efflux pump
MLSSLRNLAQTAQTLIRTREDLQVMLRFSFWVILAISLLALVLFTTPARWWVLYSVMGLTQELAEYIVTPLILSFVVAVFWGYSSLFKGLVTALRRTGRLAVTAVVRLVVVVGVGCLTFVFTDINGALVGVLALAGAFGAECALLGWQMFRGGRAATLFPPQQETDGG